MMTIFRPQTRTSTRPAAASLVGRAMPDGSIDSEAIIVSRRGGPERLTLSPTTVPDPGPGSVRVRMLAAGVSYADLMIREGLYPIDLPWPRTPGYEIVGEIEAAGPEVPAELRVGTRVAALTVTGSYARHRILPAAWCVPVPNEVDPAAAVALVLNYLTAYQMLQRVAQLERGDTLLVHGAGGGVGTAVLELAQLAGMRTIGLCSKSKHPLVESLGGIPIDYRTENVEARVSDLTDGLGVDAVLDAIGGQETRRAYRLVRTTGRVVCFGLLSSASRGRLSILASSWTFLRMPKFSPFSLFQQSKSVLGYHVGRWRDHRPSAYRQDLTHLLVELAEGRLRPEVTERFALADAGRAQRLLGRAEGTGKFVLLNT